VDRLADDATGHPPHVLHPSGDDPEIRASVVQMVPKRLALGKGYVRAQVPGGSQYAKRKRIEYLDGPGARFVCRVEHLAKPVLEQPVEVRVLHHNGRDVFAEFVGALGWIREGEDLDLEV